MPHELEEIAKSVCRNHSFIFDKYVGAGSFKETYHVLDGEKSLALKVYRRGFSPERTKREIDAMLVCDHPNIGKLNRVSLFDFLGHTYLFTMEEYFSGGTLTNKISHSCLSVEETINLAKELIEAIEHIASHELVHRDLKPDNIMFRDDGKKPVIVDFGLVRNLRNESLTQTWLMQGPGSPYFAAPEQLNNQKDLIDWRTDQFSLGVLLSICVFGLHPYAQPNDQLGDVVLRIVSRQPYSDNFQKKCNEYKLEHLIRMVDPWPIGRFRTPKKLLESWNGIGKGE